MKSQIEQFLTRISKGLSISNLDSGIISGNSVEKIVIENGANLKSIPYGAFMNSKRLNQIIFSNVTHTLDEYSIAFCTSLKEVIITSNIRVLSDYCFSGCTSLANIIIEGNSQLETIENSALNSLTNLETIIIKTDCKGFTTSPNHAILYTKDMSTIVKYCCNNKAESIDISSNVKNIGWCCFEGAKHLLNISLPNSISSIGFCSFADCIKLSTIRIPDSVNYIGNQAFDNCIGLQCGSVKFPSFLKMIL